MPGIPRIRWEQDEHGGFAGRVASEEPEAFRIRQGHDDKWRLARMFPTGPGWPLVGAGPEELKAEAERWLERDSRCGRC